MSANDPKIEAATRVSISIELDIDDLTLGDCYPDGIPADVDSENLLAVIQSTGSLTRFMRDWCLDDDATLTVSVKGTKTAMGTFRRSFTATTESKP